MNRLLLLLVPFALLAAPSTRAASPADWRSDLERRLPLLGHRNWIAVVDSAYPLQNSSGVETLVTNATMLDVVREVLGAIEKTKSVRPSVWLDAELPFVAEAHAPGITSYRAELARLLRGAAFQSEPHEQIIRRLDTDGGTFRILVLKTNLALPYTSVFIRLECGYWSDKAEQELRQTMAAHR